MNLILPVLIILFVLIFALLSIRIVPQAQVKIVERLGRFHRVIGPGINIILPFFDSIKGVNWRVDRTTITRNYIDMREQVMDFLPQRVITKDNVTMEIDSVIYWQVMNPVKSVYEVANLFDAIEKLTMTTLRNIIGGLDLDSTLVSREMINSKMRIVLDEATDKWGVRVNRVEIKDIIPPQDIKDAMEKQMIAERDKRARILESEGLKTSAILKAEGERESAIKCAEGKRESAIIEAEGEAKARLKIAEAEAEAIKRISDSIKGGNPTQYLIALKYLDSLQKIAQGNATKIFLPYEATGILSSISAIKEGFATSERKGEL
jgi:regulator of protease activity HflC (stomatin/prohibitin superfamily)